MIKLKISIKSRKNTTSDAGVMKQQNQQSLLKCMVNPSSKTSESNTAKKESTDVDMEDLADTKVDEKV